MEALLTTWSKLDDLNSYIQLKLHSDDLNRIINADYKFNFKFSESLEDKENYLSAFESRLKSPPTHLEKLSSLGITESDLEEIELELEKAHVYLSSYRTQIADLFRGASVGSGLTDIEKQVPAYNRLQLTMDKLKFELNYLRTNLDQTDKPGLLQQQDENRLHIDLDANQITYKSNSTQRHPSMKSDYSDMMTNIHLDFQVKRFPI